MKIAPYALKSTASFIESRQHFCLSSSFQQLTPPWSDLIKWGPASIPFYQPIFFLSSSFQQLTPSWSDLIKRSSVSISFYHRSHTDQHFNSWSFQDQTKISSALISTIGSYRPTFDFFSAGIIPRRQHHMKIFDDFHIGGYFHLFSFMSWILNFISIYPINGMNKWSILIIYLFMK